MLIRRIESVTNHYAGNVCNLDSEKFRNISIPYEGETDEDFLNYIQENSWRFDEISDEFDEETQEELYTLTEITDTVIWTSTMKGTTEWYESGQYTDEEKKNFDVDISTNW